MITFGYQGPVVNPPKEEAIKVYKKMVKDLREKGETEYSAYGHIALRAIEWCRSNELGFTLHVKPKDGGYKVKLSQASK